jgi:hypothetical protein
MSSAAAAAMSVITMAMTPFTATATPSAPLRRAPTVTAAPTACRAPTLHAFSFTVSLTCKPACLCCLLQLSQLLAQCDESNVQLATKVVSKATVVVVDTKEC